MHHFERSVMRHWKLIQTETEMNQALVLTDKEDQALIIDTETNGLHPYSGNHIIGISWYLPSCNKSFYAPFRHEHKDGSDVNLSDDALQALIATFNRKSDIPHIYFNALFDLHMLAKEGYDAPKSVEDVMIAAHLADENGKDFGRNYKLKSLSARWLSTEDYDPVAGEKELEAHARELGVNPKSEMHKMPPSMVAYYACMDVILTWELRNFYIPVLEAWRQTRLYENRNRFLRTVLFPMEQAGFPVDVDVAQSYIDKYTPQAEAIQAKYPVNLNSPTELKPYLKARKIIKGNSTDKVALVEASLDGSKVADDILEYRRITKQMQFYKSIVDKVDADGMLRTSYFPIGANTGRMSARDPNLQQIPRKSKQHESHVKKSFVAPPGWRIIQVDYSQLELRLAAHYARQKEFIERYLRGEDQHTATAQMLSELLNFEFERSIGKNANFGLLYGMGARQARRQWSKEGIHLDIETTGKIVVAWNTLYPEFKLLRRELKHMAMVERSRPDGSGEGFMYLQLPYNNRTRKMHEYKWWADEGFKEGWRPDYEAGKMLNSLIQGTGAAVCEDGIYRTMLQFGEYDWFHPLYTVHDSFGFMVPESYVAETVPEVVRLMSDMTSFTVPLLVEAETSSTTWYDLKEYVG